MSKPKATPKKKPALRTTAMPKPEPVRVEIERTATMYIADCPCAYPEKEAKAQKIANEAGAKLTIKRTALDRNWQSEAKKLGGKLPFVVVNGEIEEL